MSELLEPPETGEVKKAPWLRFIAIFAALCIALPFAFFVFWISGGVNWLDTTVFPPRRPKDMPQNAIWIDAPSLPISWHNGWWFGCEVARSAIANYCRLVMANGKGVYAGDYLPCGSQTPLPVSTKDLVPPANSVGMWIADDRLDKLAPIVALRNGDLLLPVVVRDRCESIKAGQTAGTSTKSAGDCAAAAKVALGQDANVARCGQLIGTDGLETVVFVPLKGFSTTHDGIPVAKLVVLRKAGVEWHPELAVDKHSIRNGIGYIRELGAGSFVGYRVSVSDHGADDAPGAGFTIWLSLLHDDGGEELPLQISWNPSVRRFQEFAYEGDPKEFRSEIKKLNKPLEPMESGR